jgi:nucleotide-binding universal stress UspA family protein
MHKIIVPVDGSQNSLLGARHAIGLAAVHPEATVYLVNAQPSLNRHIAQFASQRDIDGARTARGQQALEAARRLVEAAGVRGRSVVLRSEPARTIARFAVEERADQIVLGTSPKNALVRLLTGSITDRLLARAEVPVAVVNGAGPSALRRYGIPAGVGAGLAALLLAAE